MLVGGSFHGDFRVCIIVFRHHKYGSCFCLLLCRSYGKKGHRVEGEEGVVSPMVWTSCDVHLKSLCLSCLCV